MVQLQSTIIHLDTRGEFSRTSLASRMSSRTHFEVLGHGLEASSPRKLACPGLENRTIFWIVKNLCSAWKIFWKTFFYGNRPDKFLWRPFFLFFLKSTCACVLGPWLRAYLFLASRVSVLGKDVLGLGLGFFVSLASSLVFSTPPLLDTVN